ncbi:MAG: M23 family metallopeptidase [Deltaproteobacteria bacterium]|jgi:murein DD-endopeptidase MepM/ murein hydrolase activator NlpD|nr:M23 family metallopeptidase [Deltaproteobacteria bacterium]MBW2530735.1 M23 family metallopeptidase [Deltaproteobacteria bacterium]
MPVFPIPFVPELSYTTGARYFGAGRSKGRKHGGCDLIAPRGTDVYAVDDGTVIQGPYYFYEGTYALEVKHKSFVVRYGEIEKKVAAGIEAGAKLEKGQRIGDVGKLKMLHFEMYSGAKTGALTVRGNKPYQRRSDLINPTAYLDAWPLLSGKKR